MRRMSKFVFAVAVAGAGASGRRKYRHAHIPRTRACARIRVCREPCVCHRVESWV